MAETPTENAHGEIIEAIYHGVTDRAALEEALHLAIRHLDASGGNVHVIGVRDLETRFFCGVGQGYSDKAIAAFLDHWQYANAHRDAMRRAFERHGASVYLCHEHISARDWERAAYFQDFFARIGQRWLAGGLARSGKDTEVSIAFSRALGQTHFGEAEGRFIASLLPHIRRAAGIALKFGTFETPAPLSLTSSLSGASQAAFLVDGEARLHWLNPAAETLLQSCHALAIRDGRFSLASEPAEQAFRRGVRSAIDKACFNTAPSVLQIGEGRLNYEVETLPASVPTGGLVGLTSLALVMVRRRGLTPEVAARLKATHGLTVAEADLALLIADGHTIVEVARLRGVKQATVRAQLRSVFGKTGVTRAHTLAAEVWSLA